MSFGSDSTMSSLDGCQKPYASVAKPSFREKYLVKLDSMGLTRRNVFEVKVNMAVQKLT